MASLLRASPIAASNLECMGSYFVSFEFCSTKKTSESSESIENLEDMLNFINENEQNFLIATTG